MKKYTEKQLKDLYGLIKESETPDLNGELVKREKSCNNCKWSEPYWQEPPCFKCDDNFSEWKLWQG